ncbi:hypothetical protein BTVI_85019 [Pitangus sulphuratus]|nr:hypothetical protein BTVI_85019 [Pitangus sulphuratus]
MKMMRGMEHISCEYRLRKLEFFSLERRLWGDLTAVLQYLRGVYRKAGACNDGKRGNGFELKEERFRLDTRKKFYTMRLAKHWNMPRKVVDMPSLEMLKAGLDRALGNLWPMTGMFE